MKPLTLTIDDPALATRTARRIRDRKPVFVQVPGISERVRLMLDETPNAETLAAIKEADEGGGMVFNNADDMMKYLQGDD